MARSVAVRKQNGTLEIGKNLGVPEKQYIVGNCDYLLGRVLINPLCKRGSVNVRFAPEATEVLRCRELTRCATTGPMHRSK